MEPIAIPTVLLSPAAPQALAARPSASLLTSSSASSSSRLSGPTSVAPDKSQTDPFSAPTFANLVHTVLQRAGNASDGAPNHSSAHGNANADPDAERAAQAAQSVSTSSAAPLTPTFTAPLPPTLVFPTSAAAAQPRASATSPSAGKPAQVSTSGAGLSVPAIAGPAGTSTLSTSPSSLASAFLATPPFAIIPPPALSTPVGAVASSGTPPAVGVQASSSGQGISESQGGIDPRDANPNDKVDALAAAISAGAEPLASESSANNPAATPASFKINTSLPAGFSGFPKTGATAAPGSNTALSAPITVEVSAARVTSLATDSQPAIFVANLAKTAPAFSKVSAVDVAGPAAAKSLDARQQPLSPQPLSSVSGELAKMDATLQTQPARTVTRTPADDATTLPDTTVSGSSSDALPLLLPFPDHAAALALTTGNAKLSATENQTVIAQGAAPVAAATTNSSNSAQNSASQHSSSGSSDEAASATATSSKSSTAAAFAPALETASRSDAGAPPQNPAGTAIVSATGGATPSISSPPVSAHVASPNADTASSAALSHDPAATDPSANALPSPATDATAPNHLFSASQPGGAGDAQLAQNGGRSEIHVALQTDNLGTIELHARVSGDSIGAAITVERRDAHTALAADLPVLQQALSDKQLRVEQISLVHVPLHATGATAQHFGGQGQPGGRPSSNSSQSAGSAERGGLAAFNGFTAEAAEIFDAQGRLSVHA
jgi:trimeric autotransporter adhesin